MCRRSLHEMCNIKILEMIWLRPARRIQQLQLTQPNWYVPIRPLLSIRPLLHHFSSFQPNFPHPMNMSMNPNYIEDFNGSDYVCMTRSIPQSVSKLAAMTTVASVGVSQHYSPKLTIATSSTTATGSPKHMQSNSVSSIDQPIVGTASAGMQLTSKNLQTLQQQEQLASNAAAQLQIGGGSVSEKATSVSPTPSQLSSGSSKWKLKAFFGLKFFNGIYLQRNCFHRNRYCHTMWHRHVRPVVRRLNEKSKNWRVNSKRKWNGTKIKANTLAFAIRAATKWPERVKHAKQWAICITRIASFAVRVAGHCVAKHSTMFMDVSIAKKTTWWFLHTKSISFPFSNSIVFFFFHSKTVFGLPTNGREMCNLRTFDHGNGECAGENEIPSIHSSNI